MKHILIKTGIVAAAMFSFAACDNSELELDNLIPDEYKRVVSIKDTPSADMELFGELFLRNNFFGAQRFKFVFEGHINFLFCNLHDILLCPQAQFTFFRL